jgi:hypothetical protein
LEASIKEQAVNFVCSNPTADGIRGLDYSDVVTGSD